MIDSRSTEIVGRLAPSPTGGLHAGHARTFALAWLAARSRGGRILLRIEDLDASRTRPGAAQAAIDDLAWLGLDCDGPPVFQSQRTTSYREALKRLARDELIYPCTCTRADIERAASAPHASDEGPTYPGTCRHRSSADAEAMGNRPFAWRFRVGAGPVAWDDLFLGPQAIDPSVVGGDFVVARSPFAASYQLAVVCDDAATGVTQVIRGDDLTPSTPRQILLDRSLGGVGRSFGHVPLVVGRDGNRLAKRDGSIKLGALRASGVDPARVVGWVAWSCGWTDRIEPSTLSRWIDHFDPRRLPSGPAIFDRAMVE